MVQGWYIGLYGGGILGCTLVVGLCILGCTMVSVMYSLGHSTTDQYGNTGQIIAVSHRTNVQPYLQCVRSFFSWPDKTSRQK